MYKNSSRGGEGKHFHTKMHHLRIEKECWVGVKLKVISTSKTHDKNRKMKKEYDCNRCELKLNKLPYIKTPKTLTLESWKEEMLIWRSWSSMSCLRRRPLHLSLASWRSLLCKQNQWRQPKAKCTVRFRRPRSVGCRNIRLFRDTYVSKTPWIGEIYAKPIMSMRIWSWSEEISQQRCLHSFFMLRKN